MTIISQFLKIIKKTTGERFWKITKTTPTKIIPI